MNFRLSKFPLSNIFNLRVKKLHFPKYKKLFQNDFFKFFELGKFPFEMFFLRDRKFLFLKYKKNIFLGKSKENFFLRKCKKFFQGRFFKKKYEKSFYGKVLRAVNCARQLHYTLLLKYFSLCQRPKKKQVTGFYSPIKFSCNLNSFNVISLNLGIAQSYWQWLLKFISLSFQEFF